MRDTMLSFEEFNALTLKFMSDGQARHSSEIKDHVVERAQFLPEVLAERIPSGESRARHRVGWACSNLFRAGLLDKPARAVYQVSQSGLALLPTVGDTLGEEEFEQQPRWQEYLRQRAERERDRSGGKSRPRIPKLDRGEDLDPENAAIAAIEKLNTELAVELLQRLRQGSPEFFEQAVIKVLAAMEYGGKDQRNLDALVRASHVGKSNDGGIDGIIKQDPLGVQNIYIQAKRYQEGNNIGRDALQGFVGALHGKGVTRGVFITTSAYTPAAQTYANSEAKDRVVIIDGVQLTDLMLTYGVGVQTKRTLELREIDEDFFE